MSAKDDVFVSPGRSSDTVDERNVSKDEEVQDMQEETESEQQFFTPLPSHSPAPANVPLQSNPNPLFPVPNSQNRNSQYYTPQLFNTNQQSIPNQSNQVSSFQQSHGSQHNVWNDFLAGQINNSIDILRNKVKLNDNQNPEQQQGCTPVAQVKKQQGTQLFYQQNKHSQQIQGVQNVSNDDGQYQQQLQNFQQEMDKQKQLEGHPTPQPHPQRWSIPPPTFFPQSDQLRQQQQQQQSQLIPQTYEKFDVTKVDDQGYETLSQNLCQNQQNEGIILSQYNQEYSKYSNQRHNFQKEFQGKSQLKRSSEPSLFRSHYSVSVFDSSKQLQGQNTSSSQQLNKNLQQIGMREASGQLPSHNVFQKQQSLSSVAASDQMDRQMDMQINVKRKQDQISQKDSQILSKNQEDDDDEEFQIQGPAFRSPADYSQGQQLNMYNQEMERLQRMQQQTQQQQDQDNIPYHQFLSHMLQNQDIYTPLPKNADRPVQRTSNPTSHHPPQLQQGANLPNPTPQISDYASPQTLTTPKEHIVQSPNRSTDGLGLRGNRPQEDDPARKEEEGREGMGDLEEWLTGLGLDECMSDEAKKKLQKSWEVGDEGYVQQKSSNAASESWVDELLSDNQNREIGEQGQFSRNQISKRLNFESSDTEKDDDVEDYFRKLQIQESKRQQQKQTSRTSEETSGSQEESDSEESNVVEQALNNTPGMTAENSVTNVQPNARSSPAIGLLSEHLKSASDAAAGILSVLGQRTTSLEYQNPFETPPPLPPPAKHTIQTQTSIRRDVHSEVQTEDPNFTPDQNRKEEGGDENNKVHSHSGSTSKNNNERKQHALDHSSLKSIYEKHKQFMAQIKQMQYGIYENVDVVSGQRRQKLNLFKQEQKGDVEKGKNFDQNLGQLKERRKSENKDQNRKQIDGKNVLDNHKLKFAEKNMGEKFYQNYVHSSSESQVKTKEDLSERERQNRNMSKKTQKKNMERTLGQSTRKVLEENQSTKQDGSEKEAARKPLTEKLILDNQNMQMYQQKVSQIQSQRNQLNIAQNQSRQDVKITSSRSNHYHPYQVQHGNLHEQRKQQADAKVFYPYPHPHPHPFSIPPHPQNFVLQPQYPATYYHLHSQGVHVPRVSNQQGQQLLPMYPIPQPSTLIYSEPQQDHVSMQRMDCCANVRWSQPGLHPKLAKEVNEVILNTNKSSQDYEYVLRPIQKVNRVRIKNKFSPSSILREKNRYASEWHQQQQRTAGKQRSSTRRFSSDEFETERSTLQKQYRKYKNIAWKAKALGISFDK